MKAINILSVIFASVYVSAGSWNRRVYYTDLACKSAVQYGIQVFRQQSCSVVSAVNAACEVKSTENILSSEGTGCDAASSASDDTYFPPSGMGYREPNTNYIAVNEYTGSTCAPEPNIVEIKQILYIADSKCHVFEPTLYFVASCNAQGSKIQFCQNSDCSPTNCVPTRPLLQDAPISILTYDGTCSKTFSGFPTRGSCLVSPGAPIITDVSLITDSTGKANVMPQASTTVASIASSSSSSTLKSTSTSSARSTPSAQSQTNNAVFNSAAMGWLVLVLAVFFA